MYNKHSETLPSYMDKWSLADAGFQYNVVAVFGSQSTGKSKIKQLGYVLIDMI